MANGLNIVKKVLLIGFLSLVILVVGFIISGLYSFKNSEAYMYAKEYVATNSEVNKRIGKVVGYGFMVGGYKTSQNAHLSFSVNGTNGDVGIIIDLHKDYGKWIVDKISYY